MYATQQLSGQVGAWWASYLAHCQQIITWHGTSFALLSVVTTCQRARYAAGLLSF
jgi:hypothetical protein